MSYGIYAPCRACALEETCTDRDKIQEAVYAIHNSGTGHKGGGTIAIQCSNIRPLTEFHPDAPGSSA